MGKILVTEYLHGDKSVFDDDRGYEDSVAYAVYRALYEVEVQLEYDSVTKKARIVSAKSL